MAHKFLFLMSGTHNSFEITLVILVAQRITYRAVVFFSISAPSRLRYYRDSSFRTQDSEEIDESLSWHDTFRGDPNYHRFLRRPAWLSKAGYRAEPTPPSEHQEHLGGVQLSLHEKLRPGTHDPGGGGGATPDDQCKGLAKVSFLLFFCVCFALAEMFRRSRMLVLRAFDELHDG